MGWNIRVNCELSDDFAARTYDDGGENFSEKKIFPAPLSKNFNLGRIEKYTLVFFVQFAPNISVFTGLKVFEEGFARDLLHKLGNFFKKFLPVFLS